MELKDAAIKSLTELCKIGDTNNREKNTFQVTIPYYQRPYKWDKAKITTLFSDFFKSKEEKCEEYFVGSVVMVEKDSNKSNHNKRYDIIDGQQRITTLFLLNYLQFVFYRAYIEELLTVRKTSKVSKTLDGMIKVSFSLFDEDKICLLEQMQKEIEQVLEECDDEKEEEKKEKLWADALSIFQKRTGLPEKNFSDKIVYLKNYNTECGRFLDGCELGLQYDRTLYNDKLCRAMKNCTVIFSNAMSPEFISEKKIDDPIIEHYIQSLYHEFEALMEETKSIDKPLDRVNGIIEKIAEMIENIKFCVIITGRAEDAYILFEVLNDRSMPIEDLDLIKNLLYKWYCKHTKDDERKIDQYIEKADKIWVEEVFTSSTGKEQAKLISFLTAEFFTADEGLKFKDTARYRESLEKHYLEEKQNKNGTVYSGEDLLNDIKIYQMVAIILRVMDFKYQKKAEKVLATECEEKKSITCKVLHLLHALKLYGVLPAIINVIIKTYLDSYKDENIDITKFEEYVQSLKDDVQNKKDEFQQIHKLSYDFWRYSLMAKKADIPRQIAKKYVEKNNIFKQDFQYRVSDYDKKLKEEFKQWIYNWKYGTGDDQLKVKVLFIELFEMEKEDDQLVSGSTSRQFVSANIQLDHMEASNPMKGMEEKYFKPLNANEQRDAYVDSIGNFMIMDQKDNNDKKNLSLQDALPLYRKMASNHWMIQEVEAMLQNENFANQVSIAGEAHYIPKEEFFNERRVRLLKYFNALLSREFEEKSVKIQ